MLPLCLFFCESKTVSTEVATFNCGRETILVYTLVVATQTSYVSTIPDVWYTCTIVQSILYMITILSWWLRQAKLKSKDNIHSYYKRSCILEALLNNYITSWLQCLPL